MLSTNPKVYSADAVDSFCVLHSLTCSLKVIVVDTVLILASFAGCFYWLIIFFRQLSFIILVSKSPSKIC